MDSAVSALVDAVNNLAYGVQKTHLNVAIVAADKLLERAADYENTEDLTAALTVQKLFMQTHLLLRQKLTVLLPHCWMHWLLWLKELTSPL